MAFANPITKGKPTARAPRLGSDDVDAESGEAGYTMERSRSSSPARSNTPTSIKVEPTGPEILAKAIGPGVLSGKGKKKTRKHKKSHRKTKKHLRRK